MRIAVASNGFEVASHFTQCQNFNIYTTKSYEIASSQNIPFESATAQENANLLAKLDVDVVVAGELSSAAHDALEAQGIAYVEQAEGTALEAAQAYLEAKAATLDADLADDE